MASLHPMMTILRRPNHSCHSRCPLLVQVTYNMKGKIGEMVCRCAAKGRSLRHRVSSHLHPHRRRSSRMGTSSQGDRRERASYRPRGRSQRRGPGGISLALERTAASPLSAGVGCRRVAPTFDVPGCAAGGRCATGTPPSSGLSLPNTPSTGIFTPAENPPSLRPSSRGLKQWHS